MHRPLFWHSFAMPVAPILLSVLAFNFLNKKRTNARRNAKDANTCASGSLAASTETISGAFSLLTAPMETNISASSLLITLSESSYDVFLSFEGSDIQEGFIDYLYNALVDAGFRAFRDDDKLYQGEEICRNLLGAIKNSKILIPIISVNYGSSKWCLDELVQMMECKNNNMGHIVLPIFYKVEPTHVRHQIGSFGEAFHNRETCFDPTILEKWKQALNEVSFLKGWEAKRNDGELVKSIVQRVWSDLKKEFENLIGIDNHGEKVMKFVNSNSSATPFVGIHGIEGIDLDGEIVCEEIQEGLQYDSSFWDSKEVMKVLKKNKGTDQIKAIYLTKGSPEGSSEITDHGGNISTDEQFENSTRLMFLHVSGVHFCGDFKNSFEEVRWRRWWNYLLNNFNVKKLVALDLSGSKITDKWQGWSFIMIAEKLRFLNLTSCESLRSIVFLSTLKNLEVLILQDCWRLEHIDSSIGDMKLKYLDLTRCESLRSAIFLSAFKNLEVLILKDYWRLEQIDSSVGDMKLKYLDLTSCESLRSTVFLSAFKNLEVLILKDCEEVEQIDFSIGDMNCLVLLDLTGCKTLKELPVEVGKLKALEQLFLKGSLNIFTVPDIGALQNLKILKICHMGIKELPNGIGRLSKLQDLDVSWCTQLRGEMTESFHDFSSLQRLDFHGCEKLQLLPYLPSGLTYLSITCQSHRLPSLSHLTHLKELRLHDCRFLECFQPIDVEKSLNKELEILKICGCKFMEILDVSQLNHLRILFAECCGGIVKVRGLDKLNHLKSLTIKRCASIKRLVVSKSKGLKILNARYCENLAEIEGLDSLEFLEELYITEDTLIERLDVSKSKGLKILDARYCENLVEIEGLDSLEFLEELYITKDTLIERLDLTKSKGLKIFTC